MIFFFCPLAIGFRPAAAVDALGNIHCIGGQQAQAKHYVFDPCLGDWIADGIPLPTARFVLCVDELWLFMIDLQCYSGSFLHLFLRLHLMQYVDIITAWPLIFMDDSMYLVVWIQLVRQSVTLCSS